MTTYPAQIKNHAAQREKSKIVDLFNPFEQINSFFSFRYNHWFPRIPVKGKGQKNE